MIYATLFLLANVALFGYLFYRYAIQDKSPDDYAAMQRFLKRIKGR